MGLVQQTIALSHLKPTLSASTSQPCLSKRSWSCSNPELSPRRTPSRRFSLFFFFLSLLHATGMERAHSCLRKVGAWPIMEISLVRESRRPRIDRNRIRAHPRRLSMPWPFALAPCQPFVWARTGLHGSYCAIVIRKTMEHRC